MNRLAILGTIILLSPLISFSPSVTAYSSQPHHVGNHTMPIHSAVLHSFNSVDVSKISNLPFYSSKTLPYLGLSANGAQANGVQTSPPTVTSTYASGTVKLATKFSGLGYGDAQCGCVPPDVTVAAGPATSWSSSGTVFEMVNLAGEIWTQTGVAAETFPLYGFFGVPSTDFISDPKVAYDSLSGHFFATITDITASEIILASSLTSDPTGTWQLLDLPACFNNICPNGFQDQPILGFTSDKVTINSNVYQNCYVVSGNCNYLGAEWWVLGEASIFSSTTYADLLGLNANGFSDQPAISLSGTKVQWVVSTEQYYFGSANQVDLYKMTGVPSATTNVKVKEIFAPVNAFPNQPPAGNEPGCPGCITTNDNRIGSVQWYKNSLWFTFNEGCVPSGSTTEQACVRMIEITTGKPLLLTQDFDIASPGTDYYYAAIGISSKGIIVVAGSSSSTLYPSVVVTGQKITDTVNEYRAPVMVVSGLGADNSTRWGDYFGAAVNPVSKSHVWIAGEYGTGLPSPSTANEYGTYIAYSHLS